MFQEQGYVDTFRRLGLVKESAEEAIGGLAGAAAGGAGGAALLGKPIGDALFKHETRHLIHPDELKRMGIDTIKINVGDGRTLKDLFEEGLKRVKKKNMFRGKVLGGLGGAAVLGGAGAGLGHLLSD